MNRRLRVLITGFGPFPGAPHNPTMPLVKRLVQLRRPAFDDVELTSHIFHVTYRTVDRELPELIARVRPQVLLMFGLAGRTDYLRIESRARNAVTTTFPDADRSVAINGAIVPGAGAQTFGPHTARLLRAARRTGIDARTSRDAGSYLCNYLSWRAIEAANRTSGPHLAQFVHIPPLPRDSTARRKGISPITLDELVDAGEAMLMELVRLARQSVRRETQHTPG